MKRTFLLLLCLCLLAGFTAGCAQPQAESIAEPPGAEQAAPAEQAAAAPAAAADLTADGGVVFSAEGAALSGKGIEMSNQGNVRITEAGVYSVAGASDSARIVIEAAETDAVTLVLSGCDLTCPDDEVVYFKTAGSAAVVLADGTQNVLTSGAAPEEAEEAADEGAAAEEGAEEEDASGAALRAKTTLTVSGAGSLAVYGNINNGVASTGDLTVTGGSISIASVNDALKSRGVLTVTGGTIAIDSQADGVQADGDIVVSGGELNIVTGGGAAAADMKVSDSSMFGNGGPGGGPFGDRDRDRSSDEPSDKAEDDASDEAAAEPAEDEAEAPDEAAADEAEAPDEAAADEAGDASGEAGRNDRGGERGGAPGEGERGNRNGASDENGENNTDNNFGRMPWDADDENSVSRKGLKTDGNIIVSGGTIALDTGDDAFHASGDVEIRGGDIQIASADDGVHADGTLTVSGGSVKVDLCYEGLEATAIIVTDGIVDVTANDDGFNVNGGDFGFPGFGRGSDEPEEEETAEEETAEEEESVDPVLRITGGTVIIDSGGDGLDSNGDLFIEGGVIRVSGPSTDWDAALDSGDGGYSLVISGGDVLAGGYSGMMESPELADNSQPSIYYKRSDGYCADGDPVILRDADGNEIVSYNLAHSFNCVVISSPNLVVGQTYTLIMGDFEAEITLESTLYSNRGGRSGGMGSRSRASDEAGGETDASEETSAGEEAAG